MPSDLDPLANIGGSGPGSPSSSSSSSAPKKEARAPSRLRRYEEVEFTGTAGEYFSLWFTTGFMTSFSAGFYGPWAKVRMNAYIYNNTYVKGHAFGYHATGGALLKGRIFAVLITLFSAGLYVYYPPSAFVLVPLYFLVTPWLMNKALKFRANNVSWRNIRMHWNGTYWGTMLLLYIGPLISIISLGLLYPVMTRIYYNYIADNHSMGTTSFDADLEFSACFGAFFIALLSAALAGGAILGLAAVALPSLAPSAENTEALIAYEYAYIAAAFIFQTTYMSLCRNFMVKTLRLGRIARFDSNVSPIRLAWIKLTNAILIMASLGFLYPYTVIREYIYMTSVTEYKITGDIEAFIDRERYKQSAYGDEFSEFNDIELSI